LPRERKPPNPPGPNISSKLGHEFLIFREPRPRTFASRGADQAEAAALEWPRGERLEPVVLVKHGMTTLVRDLSVDRREFLRGTARYGLLSLLAVTTGLLRRPAGRQTGPECFGRLPCAQCTAFAGCDLPAALWTKRQDQGA
jgi:hypothetical protein